MQFRVLLVAVCCTFFLAPSSASELSVLWTSRISDESYWYLAAPYNGSSLPPRITCGTFGVAYCRADTYDFTSGDRISSDVGVCRPSASPSSLGAIGYVYPNANVIFNSSGSSFAAKIDHQYYPAYGSSIVTTDHEVFVWGSRPLKDPSFGVACMFYGSEARKSLDAGPCIENYGEGEAAQDISLSSDGLVLLLTAGFKLSVYRRASTDGAFQQTFNFTFGVVVNFAALSADGSAFVCSCDDGMCGFKIDSSGSYERSWSVAAVDGFHFEQAALSLSSDDETLLVALMNNADSTQW
jgi:hypothetical protein